MRLRYTIAAVLLIMAGVGGLGVTAFRRNKEQRELAPYKLNYSRQADELLARFEDQSSLSPEEQVELLKDGGRYSAKWQTEQQLRLRADLEDLAAGEKLPGDFADLVYGRNWRQEVEKYRTKKELTELTVNASALSLSAGIVMLVIGTYRWIRRFVKEGLARGKRLRNKLVELTSSSSEPVEDDCEPELLSQSWLSTEGNCEGQSCEPEPEIASQVEIAEEENEEEQNAEDFSDKQAEPSADAEGVKYSRMSFGDIRKVFNAQAENLEQKTRAFELSVGDIEDVTPENTEMANDKLTELTEQIGAIREYATQQQERTQKLQEGYDWNIIRNFCLRIIRCIDNLESQIRKHSNEDGVTERLEQSKQELIFALESSGVEQFEVSLNSDYRGQERHLEVLKERAQPDDPQLSGKIAEVVRSGYQYIIDEENVKIVRPAQVRVYN